MTAIPAPPPARIRSKGKMVLVQPSEADRALLKKVTQEAVLPKMGRALLGPVRQGLQRHRRQDAGRDRQQVMSRLRLTSRMTSST